MKVLITGADGFVGKNLRLVLAERKDIQINLFTRGDDTEKLAELIDGVDFIFHIAGVNRPKDPRDFFKGNSDLTQELCSCVGSVAERTGRIIPVIYASSIQASLDNPYGRSKLAAEAALLRLASDYKIPVHIFRLPNIFGKWCKPNYNSVVATFCNNIIRDLPIQINDRDAPLTLVYVDDVVEQFVQIMDGGDAETVEDGFAIITPQYAITVGELADQIQAFKGSRSTLMTERVGSGLVRALYATYVSYLPVESFSYPVPQYGDPRGVFVEMLKTPDSGQFSFFTAHAGITRGGHYHHSKTEKFLVIRGQARFRFRHMQTGGLHELVTTGDKPEIVETVPGWTHDITNIGTEEMIVMLWANEVFDRARPDTFACPL
jgi:UDP-2-acetamido-2,6-beta-L-arabino-hexul-4-ose reductase